MDDYIDQIKAMSDKTRLKILWLLNKAQTELCICEIMDVIEDSHSNISRQLKILKTAKLVRERKDGKWVYVRLIAPHDPFHDCLLQAVSRVPDGYFSGVARKLTLRLGLRDGDRCVDGLRSEKWTRALCALEKEDT